jgi:hypothetical protein
MAGAVEGNANSGGVISRLANAKSSTNRRHEKGQRHLVCIGEAVCSHKV